MNGMSEMDEMTIIGCHRFCWHLYRRFGIFSAANFRFAKEKEMGQWVASYQIDRSALVDRLVPTTSVFRPPLLTLHVPGHFCCSSAELFGRHWEGGDPGVTTWVVDKWSDEYVQAGVFGVVCVCGFSGGYGWER